MKAIRAWDRSQRSGTLSCRGPFHNLWLETNELELDNVSRLYYRDHLPDSIIVGERVFPLKLIKFDGE